MFFSSERGEKITLKNFQQWISIPSAWDEKHQAEKSTLKYSFIGDTPGVPGRRKCRTAPIVQTEWEFNRQTSSEEQLTMK